MVTRPQSLAATLLALLLISDVSAQSAIRWQPTLESAKRVASQTNRLVLIHFSAPWCEACRRMEQDVFGQPDVIRAMEANYVSVKLNANDFPKTAQQFGITSLPAEAVLTSQGQLVEVLRGLPTSAQYVARLNQIASAARNQVVRSYAQVAGGPPPAGTGYSPQRPAPSSHTGQQGGSWQPNSVASGPQYNGRAPGAPAIPQEQVRLSESLSPPYGGAAVAPGHASSAPPTGQAGISPRPGSTPQHPGSPWSGQPGNPGPTSGGIPPQDSPQTPSTPGPQQSSPQTPAVAARSAVGPQSSPSAPAVQIPPGNPPLGLDGYCPVRLREQETWVLGDRRWGAIHQGRTYLFSGPEEQRRFLANPLIYGPVNAGNDVVLTVDEGRTAVGHREHGVVFGNRVYLFSSEASLERFSKRPKYYADAFMQSSRTVPGWRYR